LARTASPWYPPSSNYLTEMCSGSEEGSYLRLIVFVYHSTLGLRVIKKKEKVLGTCTTAKARFATAKALS